MLILGAVRNIKMNSVKESAEFLSVKFDVTHSSSSHDLKRVRRCNSRGLYKCGCRNSNHCTPTNKQEFEELASNPILII
jgi:hypothetical protein